MADDQIRFNKPSLEGNELAYIQTAVETGHTSCSGPFASAASELLPRLARRSRRPAHHVVHRRARDVGDAARPPARRHRRGAVVHVHVHRVGVRPRGRQAPLLRHRARPRSDSTPRTSPGCSPTTSRSAPWCPCTTRASAATWPASRPRSATAPSTSSKTTRTACSAGTAAGRSATSAASRRSASTRRRTSSAVKAARSSSTTSATSPAPTCSTTRAPTGGRSCSARSTSTRGRTSDRRSV